MTVLRSGGRITVMRLLRTKLKILIPVLLVITAISAAVFIRQQKKILVIEELETGNVYREIPVKTGDELSSGNIPLSIFHGTSITRYRKTEASFSTPSRSRASVPEFRQRWTANTATKTDSSTWMRSKASFRSSTGSIPRQP